MIGGSLWVLRPFLPALIWATTVVVATWPLMLALQKKRLWHKRTLAAIGMIGAILLIIVLPLVGAVITLVDHSDQIVALVKAIPGYIFCAAACVGFQHSAGGWQGGGRVAKAGRRWL